MGVILNLSERMFHLYILQSLDVALTTYCKLTIHEEMHLDQ